jgi:type II secretory pathway component PulC
MGDLLQKRSTQIVMILLVLVIWAYNMVQFVSIQNETETVRDDLDMSGIESFEFNDLTTYEYSYSGNFKDPFLPSIQVRQPPLQPSPDPISVQQEPERPSIQLYGIVEASAVVKLTGNQTHFMEEGDAIEGIYLQSLYADSATFSFNDEPFTLILD